jgi:hypothetical protein
MHLKKAKLILKLKKNSEIRITPVAVNEEIKLLQAYSGEDQTKCVLRYIKHVSGKKISKNK